MPASRDHSPRLPTLFIICLALLFSTGGELLAESASSSGGGVTLYSDTDFRGRSQTFHRDDPQLADDYIRQDSASSVRVASGCEVTLYEHPNYEGRSTTLSYDVDNLYYSRIGSDTVSSIRVQCRRGYGGGGYGGGGYGDGGHGGGYGDGGYGQGGGVILFEDDDFRGEAERFTYDDPRLADNLIGNDRASSVRVAPGCEAVLYEDENFRGRSTLVRGDVRGLRSTVVGNDQVSSIEVDCRRVGGGPHPAPDWGHRRGVALYEDSGFRGEVEILYDDDASLENNAIGNDRVSSIRVAPGCEVTLYEDSGFRGTSITVRDEIEDLRYSRVGNDELSSLRIDCGRRGGWDRPGADWQGERGVILYEDSDFRGREELFTRDDSYLNDNPIRQDSASSVRVAPGCRAILYEHPNYEGRAVEVTDDVPRLSSTHLGNDAVSSIRVDCRRGGFFGRR